ncbi:hypothetical protein OESDEN_06001, partial [Oesophagostomum dentatum]
LDSFYSICIKTPEGVYFVAVSCFWREENSLTCDEFFVQISSPTVAFKWKATIKRKLREAGGEMKVKKLRKTVIGAYKESGGDDEGVEELFEAKLAKSGVTVNGKLASLAS